MPQNNTERNKNNKMGKEEASSHSSYSPNQSTKNVSKKPDHDSANPMGEVTGMTFRK